MSNTVIVPWFEPSDGLRLLFLNKRETQVLKGISEGKPIKAIASDMKLSPSATYTHMENLKDKLGVTNGTPLWPIALRVFGKEKSP